MGQMRSCLKAINAIIALYNRSCICLCRLNTRIYYHLMNVSKFLCIVKLRNNKVVPFYIFYLTSLAKSVVVAGTS